MRILLFVFLFYSVALYGTEKEKITSLHEEAYPLLDTDFEKAFEIGLKTEILAHDAGFDYEEANSIFIQAWILQNKKFELGKSFILYLKALEVLKETYNESDDLRKLYLSLLTNTGNLLKDHFAYSSALIYYEKAIEIAKDAKNYEKLSSIFWNKADLLNQSGRSVEALDMIELAIRYAKVTKKERMIIGTINQKGIILIALGQLEPALKAYENILNHEFREMEEYLHKGYALHNIGHAYFSSGDIHSAIAAYKKAHEYKLKFTDPNEQFITLADLAEAHLMIKDYNAAKEYALKALAIYPDVQLLPKNYNIFEFLSSVAFEHGQYELSRKYTKKYIDENDKFLKLQEELQQTKDQYKMEILAAGFFAESNASKDENLYNLILTIITSIFTLIIVAGISGQYLVRRSVKKSLQAIDKQDFNLSIK